MASVVLHLVPCLLVAGRAARTAAPAEPSLATVEIVEQSPSPLVSPTPQAGPAGDDRHFAGLQGNRRAMSRPRISGRRQPRPTLPLRAVSESTAPTAPAAAGATPAEGDSRREPALLTATADAWRATSEAPVVVPSNGGPGNAQGSSRGSSHGSSQKATAGSAAPANIDERGPGGALRAGATSEVVTYPVAIHEVRSAGLYPELARQLGIERVVKLGVGVDEFGRVTTVSVLKPVGYGFDEAASTALRAFRFSPARTRDGRAVPFRFTYTYAFVLED